MEVSKTTVHHWIVGSTICVHCNSLKPVLTEENKVARLLMALHFRDPVDLTKYHDMLDQILVEFWGLPPLIPLLQYVNRLGFEICSVNRMNNRTRKLGYVNLNWPRCSARVTESLALTDGSFFRKQNTLYFRLCKNCEFMMCILIVDHEFNRMHPWCSWECMLPGRCSPGKRCHTFWNRNIVLLPILLGKVSCVPNHTLCELYGVKFWEGLA